MNPRRVALTPFGGRNTPVHLLIWLVLESVGSFGFSAYTVAQRKALRRVLASQPVGRPFTFLFNPLSIVPYQTFGGKLVDPQSHAAT